MYFNPSSTVKTIETNRKHFYSFENKYFMRKTISNITLKYLIKITDTPLLQMNSTVHYIV